MRPELVIAVYAALTVFGILYNALVGWLEREMSDHGYTAFLVVGGVIVTLAGATILIGWQSAFLTGLCFAASGLPMIVGSMWRSLRRRTSERARIHRDAVNALEG